MLKEVDEDFLGYELDINKMNSNRLVSTIIKHRENLLKETTIKK